MSQLVSYDEGQALVHDHVCGVCGAPLTLPWDGELNSLVVRCGHDRTHQGYARQLSFTEMYHRGLPVPPYVEEKIKKKEEKRMEQQSKQSTAREGYEAGKALAPAKFEAGVQGVSPDKALVLKDVGEDKALTLLQIRALVEFAAAVGLHAELGHVVMYYGMPYVTIDGHYYYAHASREFDGIKTRPATPHERENAMIAEGEHCWICEVYRKGFEYPVVGFGRARGDEKDPVIRGSYVEPKHPQRLAEKRAEAQALRKAFPLGLPSIEEEREEKEIEKGETNGKD